jgi:integrase
MAPCKTTLALQLVIHTFVRTSEVRFAASNEFEDLDGDRPLNSRPAQKMRREDLVPMSPQVVQILLKIRDAAGKSEFLFQGANAEQGAVREHDDLRALPDGLPRPSHGFTASARPLPRP